MCLATNKAFYKISPICGIVRKLPSQPLESSSNSHKWRKKFILTEMERGFLFFIQTLSLFTLPTTLTVQCSIQFLISYSLFGFAEKCWIQVKQQQQQQRCKRTMRSIFKEENSSAFEETNSFRTKIVYFSIEN